MSVNIVLYFRGPTPEEVAAELGRVAERPGDTWYYPRRDGGNTLRIYAEDRLDLADYDDDPETRAALLAALGGPPTAALSVFLRLTQGERAMGCLVAFLRRKPTNRAVEDADALARRLLRTLGAAGGAVDDNWSEIWTLAEIEAGVAKRHGRFLDWLRYPERYRERDE